eukprot:Awhi_evm1s9365
MTSSMEIDEPATLTVGPPKKKESTTVHFDLPWVEKYRPLVLDDVVGNEETVSRLKVIAENGNMPNLILS